MRSLLSALLTGALAAAAREPSVTLGPRTPSGQFDVLVNGRVFLPAGTTPVALQAGGRALTAAPGGGLTAIANYEGVGSDSLGRFTHRTTTWAAKSGVELQTSARVYTRTRTPNTHNAERSVTTHPHEGTAAW